jgi:hypothetical protein
MGVTRSQDLCGCSGSARVGEEVGEVAEQQSTRCCRSWMGPCLLPSLVFSLFWSDLTVGIDAGEFGSSSGGSNHLVIEGPSSDGSRVAASLDDVNSPSSSVRSVSKYEETHTSRRQWAPVFSVPGALCMAAWSRSAGWSLFLIWRAFSDYDC